MMRYHRVSPDGLPLLNGRKPTSRTFKEDDADNNGRFSFSASDGCMDGKSLRHRSGISPSSTGGQDQTFPPSDSPQSDNQHHQLPKTARDNGGPPILQWGQNKRRCPRAERQPSADESSSPARQVIKVHRRSAVAAGGVSRPRSMAPVPYSRGTNLRPAMPVRDHHHSGSLLNRSTSEDHRSAVASPSRLHNGCGPRSHPYRRSPDSQQQPNAANNHGKQQPDTKPSEQADATEKVSSDASGWPRIYLSLSRKEKEEDFFAMKGSKLPHRPKKRAKNVDKTLQYCLPGMWLSDLTRGRYEVREKKCVKKRRRGLKAMESMDSESE